MSSSLSFGSDAAMRMVNAASVSSLILLVPEINKALFLSRKYKNIVDAILLFPSMKL